MIEHSIFSVTAELIVEILTFSCCSPFITLHNGLKISEYEVYWLKGFPLIVRRVPRNSYGNL